MLEELRKRWRALRSSDPGRRFQDRYRNNQSRRGTQNGAAPIARMAAGTALVLVGVVMLFTPGPGSLFIAVGASIVGAESLAVARLLDRIELRVRRLLAAVETWRRKGRGDDT